MIEVRRPIRPFFARLAKSAHYLIPMVLIGILVRGYVGNIVFALALIDILHKWFTLEVPLKNPERWSFIICGAGLSGLAVAHKLKESGVEDIVILEKASEVGGTWLFNTYPGVDSDVDVHFYSYSFYLNPWWSCSHGSGAEIWKYLDDFATERDLMRHIRFGHKITNITWDDDSKMWRVGTECGAELTANFFISCTGALHVPHKPVFKGQEDFKGEVFHTAEWDWSVDLEGKRVSVIGTGSSAVQVVPSIAKKVEDLYVFQRHPSWVLSRGNPRFRSILKYAFAAFPWMIRIYRYVFFVWWEIVFYALLTSSSPLRPYIKQKVVETMRESLGQDEELLKALTPDYELGYKRISPSSEYLQSFKRENVHLVTAPIDKFTRNGIVTSDGSIHESDVVILATGYDRLRTAQAWSAYGRDGQVLWKKWDDSPRAYFGMTYPGYPNAFILLGPSTKPNLGPFTFMLECQITYIMDCIRKVEAGGWRSAEVKKEALDEYVAWVDATMAKRVFRGGLANERGVNWVFWPSNMTAFWWNTLRCRKSDFIFSK